MENNKILGIVFIAIGALLLLSWLNIPYLGMILGIALVIVGVLMLTGKVSGANWLAWTLVVLGGICILAGLGLNALASIASMILTIAAIILIVVGILKLIGKM